MGPFANRRRQQSRRDQRNAHHLYWAAGCPAPGAKEQGRYAIVLAWRRQLPATGSGWVARIGAGEPGRARPVSVLSAPVAQGIEHRFPKPRVAGPNPAGGISRKDFRTLELAYLSALDSSACSPATHTIRWPACGGGQTWPGRPPAPQGRRILETKAKKANDYQQLGDRLIWMLVVCEAASNLQSHIFPVDHLDCHELKEALSGCAVDARRLPFEEIWLMSAQTRSGCTRPDPTLPTDASPRAVRSVPRVAQELGVRSWLVLSGRRGLSQEGQKLRRRRGNYASR